MWGMWPYWFFLYDIFLPLKIKTVIQIQKTKTLNLLERGMVWLCNDSRLWSGVYAGSVTHLTLGLLVLVEAVQLLMIALGPWVHWIALRFRAVFSLMLLSIWTVRGPTIWLKENSDVRTTLYGPFGFRLTLGCDSSLWTSDMSSCLASLLWRSLHLRVLHPKFQHVFGTKPNLAHFEHRYLWNLNPLRPFHTRVGLSI